MPLLKCEKNESQKVARLASGTLAPNGYAASHAIGMSQSTVVEHLLYLLSAHFLIYAILPCLKPSCKLPEILSAIRSGCK